MVTNAQLALVHVGKKRLHLDEETYRDILHVQGGVRSAKDLSPEGLDKVLARFAELGFAGRPDGNRKTPRSRRPPAAPEDVTGQLPTPGQQGMLAHLWQDPRLFAWRGNELRLLTDHGGADGEVLGANKWLVHRHKARSGAASRAGMLRVCSWMFLFKNWGLKDWMGYIEVFGVPLRLGKYDPSASAQDKEELFRALVAIASDAAGMIPSNADIEFVEAGKASGASGDVFEKMAGFCERAMSKAVLGQTLTTDTTGGTGTYAAGEVHNEVRHDLRNSDAKALAKTLQRDLFRPIVGFNLGWDRTARLPYMEFDTAEPEDLSSLANTYAVLREKVGLPIGRAHVYERFGIPAPEEGEDLVDGPAGAQPGAAPWPMTAMRGRAPGAAHAARTDPVQDAVDGLADAALGEGTGAVQAMVDPIIAAVEAATDYDDLRDRLLAAFPDLDATALEDVLARAMFMAELGGRANVR